MADLNVTEVVRIRPKDDARDRLMEIREDMVGQVVDAYPGAVSAELFEIEDGTWLDLWRWAKRSDAEEALANAEKFPAFSEWLTLVEPVALEWGEPLA